MKTDKIIYAGIGSRETPSVILGVFKKLSSDLEDMGVLLRSGGAPGADSAFALGVKEEKHKRIYIPSNGFNGLYDRKDNMIMDCRKLTKDIKDQSRIIVNRFHPNPRALKPYAMELMMRNTYQILGHTLNLVSNFVVCWTVNGDLVGGTAQALRLAKAYDIPVFNFGKCYNISQCNKLVNEVFVFVKSIK